MTDYPLLGGLSQEATQLLALTALQSLLADSPDLATVVLMATSLRRRRELSVNRFGTVHSLKLGLPY